VCDDWGQTSHTLANDPDSVRRLPIERAEWYAVRRAHSRKPATYTCPFCRRSLHAMSEHVLVLPLGDGTRRRHAHGACVAAARRDGRLPSRDEWRRSQPHRPPWWRRMWRRAADRGRNSF
jgi:hypothetical protein